MSYPFLLLPAVSELVWGGTRLMTEYAIQSEKRNAAEAWMLSCREDGVNYIQNGVFQGKTLANVLAQYPELCGTRGAAFSKFPLLVKLIDAKDDLSIQVHPDDAYCAQTGKGEGKTECWYILDCEPDAYLVLGFTRDLNREELEKAIETDEIMDYVRRVPVKKGDFFFIEAGTLHAICKGVLLAEVQQNSDTTYRIYDYNRPGLDGKPRELHVNDALAVTKRERFSPTLQAPPQQKFPGYSLRPLASCRFFTTQTVEVDDSYTNTAGVESFISLLALEGSGTLECKGEILPIQKGQSWFLPADCGTFCVRGDLQILETSL